MYRRYQNIVWVSLILVTMLGMIGCRDSSNLDVTSPLGAASQQNPNLVSRDITTVKFGVFKTFGQFGVEVPQGTYLLTYTTKIGVFQIVFQTPAQTVMPIGLQPTDDVIEATLQQGTVPATTPVVQQVGAIAVFAMPGIGIPVAVTSIFTATPIVSATGTVSEVVLVKGGQVVPGDNVQNVDTNGESTQFGIFKGNGTFEVYVPTGEYLITYTTKLGTFQLVLRANYGNFVEVPLQSGDDVTDIVVQPGLIPFGIPAVQKTGDGLFFFATPGAPAIVSNVFVINVLSTPVILVQNGTVASNTTIIVFIEPQKKKYKPHKHEPKGNAWGYWKQHDQDKDE